MEHTRTLEEPPTRSRGRRALSVSAAAGVSALAAWLIGALPWILESLRLPISSAWPSVAPQDDIRVALPFGEYELTGLLVATLVGGAVAVPLARLVSGRGTSVWIGILGATAGLGAALTQTLIAVRPLVRDASEATLLVTALVLLGVSGIAVGLFSGAGLVRRTAWWSPLSGALLAAALTSWTIDLVNGRDVTNWLTATLLAAALLWAGGARLTRLLWWPVVIAVLWFWTAVTAAMFYVGSYARSGMGDGEGRAELVDAARDVFVQASLPSNHVVAPYVVGTLVAALLTVAWRRRRLTARADTPDRSQV